MRSDQIGGSVQTGRPINHSAVVGCKASHGARTSCPHRAPQCEQTLNGILAVEYERAAHAGGQDVRAPFYLPRIVSHASTEPDSASTAPTSITRRKPNTKHSLIACLMVTRASSF